MAMDRGRRTQRRKTVVRSKKQAATEASKKKPTLQKLRGSSRKTKKRV